LVVSPGGAGPVAHLKHARMYLSVQVLLDDLVLQP
jgi:hypothetical protein